MDEYLNDYLAHHGIKGQRWGVRRTPEELGHVTKTKKPNKTAEKALNYAKQKIAERRANSKENNRERLKEYLRKHPEKLPKYGRKLTEDEANEIIKNIQYDRKLKDIRKEEYQRGLDRMKQIVDTGKTIKDALGVGKDIYNAYVDIHNSTHDEGEQLTKIGDKKQKPKEDRSAIEKIVRGGSIDDILKNVGKMTESELNTAVNRVQKQKNLEDMKKPKEDRSDIEKIVRAGSAKDIKEHIADMTASELETAMKRLKYEGTLDELLKK